MVYLTIFTIHWEEVVYFLGTIIDNIMIERWFRSLKTELIYINEFRSPRELRQSIRSYIDDYNRLRPHEALDYATPDAVYYASFRVA